jgi:hypothetical protein
LGGQDGNLLCYNVSMLFPARGYVLVPIVFVMFSLCLSGESLGGIFPSSCDEQGLLLREHPSSAVGIEREESLSV